MKNKLFFHDKNTSKIELPGKSIYDFEDLYIKTFTLEDIYQISTISQQKDSNRLISFIQSKISTDITKLTESDFKFILFWERFNSYSYSPFVLKWDCKDCYSENSTNIDEKMLEGKDLNPEYDKEGMSIDLFSGGKLVWKLPTLGDAKKAREFIDSNKLSDSSYSIAEIAQCSEFPGEELSLMEKFNRIKELKPDDFVIFGYLREEFVDYGVQEKANVECRHCGVCQQVRFHFELHSLFPDFRDTSSIRSRIFSNRIANESAEHREGGVLETPVSKEEIRRGSETPTTKTKSKTTNSGSNQPEKEVMTFDEFSKSNQ
jgi:hypothetical protein